MNKTSAAVRKAPERFHFEWVAEGDEWKVGGDHRRCRRKGCQAPAVAALRRKHGGSFAWWYYCAAHLYGRRIVNGVVKCERLVRDEVPA